MSIFKIDASESFNPWSNDFWIKIVIMTIAIWIVSFTSLAQVQGGPFYALAAAIIISLLNAFVRPLLSFISMPLIVATFGVFMLIINAVIILLTSALLKPNFYVDGFINAFFFSLIVTLMTFVMNLPRKIRKVEQHIFNQGDKENQDYNSINNSRQEENNSSSSKRFDNDRFNDDPSQKNYTDFEDID